MYRLSATPIGKSSGRGAVGHAAYQSGTRGAVASAAYRAGERLTENANDKRLEHVYDYTNKKGVEDTYLMLPQGSPDWGRQKLWNECDRTCPRANGRAALDLELALPKEASLQERQELVDGFIRPLVDKYRVAADIAHHQGADERNKHAHVMLSHRELGPGGFGDIACRHTVTRKVKGQEKQVEVAGLTAMPSDLERLRREWNDHVNGWRIEHGLKPDDHRSYERQQNGLTPTLPLGPERKGDIKREQRAEYNNRVMAARAERERQALNQAVEKSHPEPQRVETIAKVQNPEIDWQALNDRNVAEHIRKQGEASQPAISSEERRQLEREARLDRMDSGDVATPADIARQISPEYAHAEARLEAVNQQLDRTRWNRGQLDQEAQASLYQINERREAMSWFETAKHVFRQDPELASWRDVHDGSVTGYHQAARQERALEKEQTRATKAANKAYASVKADAAAELNRRHTTANGAREKLRVLDASERAVTKHPIDRAVEREQRASDYYREKVSAGRQAREVRLQGGEDFWQQTLAAGRMTRQATANATTYEDVRRLNEEAKLDRDKYGYTLLTIDDIARNLSPAFAAADDRCKALTTKAETLDKAIDAKAREQQGIKWQHDLRQERMSGIQTALNRWGPLRDKQLIDLEQTWLKLDKERAELVEHRARLTDKLGAAKDTRSAELEKVRKPAEVELAQRQATAERAREQLAIYRTRELAVERERQSERQAHQHRRGLSLGR